MKKIKNALWRALEHEEVACYLFAQFICSAIIVCLQYFGKIHPASVWATVFIIVFVVTLVTCALLFICQMQSMFDDGQTERSVDLVLTILMIISIFWFILPAALWHYFAPPKKDFVVS